MAQKPRKLIIHAGMHKTGSTAIQHWLRTANLPGSKSFKWRNANHSDLFVLLFEDDPQDHFAFARPGYTRQRAMQDRAKEKARIRRQIETAGVDVFVFSAERVSAAPDAAVAAMQAWFAEFFTDIQVYAYVRKPSGFMTSMFQQHLKTGRIKLGFLELWPNYRRRLRRLYKIFGRRNVHLRSYDKLAEQGTEIVGDFARWTGLAAETPHNIVLNWSMSATGMALLYFYRKHVEPSLTGAERARYDRHLLYAAQTIPGEAFHIDLACGKGERKKVAKDLRWISKQMGFDLDDLGAGHDGVVRFSSEADILAYAVAMSHDLMPWKHLPPLDPAAPESFEATRARFRDFLSPASLLRAEIGRGVNWATGRHTRAKT
ncbi:MAG: hypothetical protein KDK53_21155 [Maritimibacter sp.]|nr:hypothetical protein [Maritimibacter sp.]